MRGPACIIVGLLGSFISLRAGEYYVAIIPSVTVTFIGIAISLLAIIGTM